MGGMILLTGDRYPDRHVIVLKLPRKYQYWNQKHHDVGLPRGLREELYQENRLAGCFQGHRKRPWLTGLCDTGCHQAESHRSVETTEN
jgi:hypothetical protein